MNSAANPACAADVLCGELRTRPAILYHAKCSRRARPNLPFKPIVHLEETMATTKDPVTSSRRVSGWALLGALLLVFVPPTVMLWPSLFGSEVYVSFDPAEFPPASLQLDDAELQAMRDTANYDASESPLWFVPEYELVREALFERGEFPHWNPFARTGTPLVAHGHLGLFDPLHWPPLFTATPAAGLAWCTWGVFVLAGLLMLGFLRRGLQLSWAASGFGAFAFAFSGTMLANGHWHMRMEPIALLPGMLWAVLSAADRVGVRRIPCLLGLSVLMGWQWVAGFPPFSAPVTLLVAGFCGLLVLRQLRETDLGGATLLALQFLAAAALGFALAAPQLLPQALFFPHSNRTGVTDLTTVAEHTFDAAGLVGLFLRAAFSHPSDWHMPGGASPLVYLLASRHEWGLDGAAGRLAQPNYNFTEYALFPGSLILLLAVHGVAGRGQGLGRRAALLATGTIGVLFLLAVAPPIVRLIFELPGFAAMPPQRFTGPVCCFVAVLAALGVHRLTMGSGPRPQGWVALIVGFVVTVACAVCWLWLRTYDAGENGLRVAGVIAEKFVDHGPYTAEQVLQFRLTNGEGQSTAILGLQRLSNQVGLSAITFAIATLCLWFLSRGRPRTLVFALAAVAGVGLTISELGEFGWSLNRGRELRDDNNAAVEALEAARDTRLAQGGVFVARGSANGTGLYSLTPGTLADEHIRDLQFYTFVDGPSRLPLAKLYGEDWLARDYLPGTLPDDPTLQLPWWDLYGLTHVASTDPMTHAGVPVRADGEPAADAGPIVSTERGDYWLYERPNALPRAFVVPKVEVLADDEAIVARLLEPSLQPRQQVFVTTEDSTMLSGSRLQPLPNESGAEGRTVSFRKSGTDTLVLEVSDGAAGFLVLSDAWMPGWSVRVAGEGTTPSDDDWVAGVARANLCMRVVPVPQDACVVEFHYFMPGLRGGLWIAGGALAVVFAALLVWFVRRRRESEAGRVPVPAPSDPQP